MAILIHVAFFKPFDIIYIKVIFVSSPAANIWLILASALLLLAFIFCFAILAF